MKLKKLIAIGISTGGPRALQEVIPKLPSNTDAAILVVQHMPLGFTKSLAHRMDVLSKVYVKEAEDGDVLTKGCVYIAPGDRHLRVISSGNKYVIRLGSDALVSGHRPSVDAMFLSIAKLNIDKVIAVIMTGMGSDGVKGMGVLKESVNTYTIAQDKESCIVFGMPRMAIAKGVVDKVVPLGMIYDEIMKAMGV